MPKSRISPEDFVRIWQSSDSIDEVAAATGSNYLAVQRRSYDYRANGVPLKHFPDMRKRNEWDSLANLARSFYKPIDMP